MGPPETEPSGFSPRYLTPRTHSTNLVDMPRKPARMNQKVAPGPPTVTATATPPMFPMPTVPETAVASAWKCETSPAWPGSA